MKISCPVHRHLASVFLAIGLLFCFGTSFATAAPGSLTSTVLATGTPAQNLYGGYPYSFVQFQGELYFFVDPIGNGTNIQIWRYNNGSPVAANSTNLLANNANFPSTLTAAGNYLIFRGSVNGTSENELFIFDPTVAGAGAFTMVDLNSGPSSSNPSQVFASGSRVFFNATGNTFNNSLTNAGGAATVQLYVFDGIAKTLKSTAAGVSGVGSQADFNGDVVYATTNGTQRQGFRYNNGSPVAFTPAFPANIGGNGLSNFVPAGGLLYYRATTDRGGKPDDELWVYDPVASTNTEIQIYNNSTNNIGAVPSFFYADSSSRIFFTAFGFAFNNSTTATGSTNLGRQLYVVDGPTKRLTSYVIASGTTDPTPLNFAPYNGDIYFVATAATSNEHQLWRFNNGSPSRVSTGAAFEGVYPGGNAPSDLIQAGAALTFNAPDPTHGVEFWSYDGTTFTNFDIKPGTASSRPLNTVGFAGKVIFSADGNNFTGGTTAGATYIKQELYVYSPPLAAPTVTSPTSASITPNSATLGGNVTGDGGATITERGVVYSVTGTNNNPAIGGTGVTKQTSAGTTGVFTVNATGLASGTGYSFKAYATNSQGTTYTSPVSTFTTGSLPNLTINDVSLNEGNAGTTSFTFTVSLSAPAPVGGVTFDIATADGTAVAPSDYTAKSLTGQTIPAGSNTYSFTVLVNGDTTVEPSDTFFVNVTNVTGATVTDGQGQGTLVNDDVAAPTVTAINPTGGPVVGGQSVTITGTNFTGATGVTIGGTAATGITVVNTTTITATTPAGSAGAVSVVVTTPGGSNTANTLYTYFAIPTVTAINPNSGPTTGGQGVTITGTNFTGATGVTIGGTAATGVTVVNATTITATTPAHAAGTASVVVTTPGGSNSANTLYTFISGPSVSAISPNAGPTAGGQGVTITGSNFTGTTGVTIGGAAASGVMVVNDTTITATTPAGAAGPASVVVTTGLGSNGPNTLYTYFPLPTVTAISPTGGPVAGGQGVTITGTGFTGATGVTIGGTAATGITVVNSTTITATTPAHAAGAASVVVTTPGGSNTANTLYSYFAIPTVAAINPTGGPVAGGQSVTITGTGFTGATGVTIGGTAAMGVTVVNDTTITATTPAGSAGTASVVVTTPGGSNTANTLYTYFAIPTVTAINPTGGPVAGGQSVTITGTGFTGATGVTIGGTAATGITVVNATTITATTPAGSAGTASVVVTTPGGSNTANTLYTYFAIPTVTAINPTGGPVTGGQSVTITGMSLTGATGVTIGGTAATGVTVVNDTTITATTPAGSAGTASVVVTTPGGSNTANTLYTYFPLPTVTQNTTNLTQDTVTLIIAGTNFSATPANNTVALNSGTATVTASTSTQLTCTLAGPPALGSLTAVVTSNGGSSGAPVQVATIVASVTYTVVTTGNQIVVTDIGGNGDTLAVSEPGAGNIQFDVAGRTFDVDGTLLTGGSGPLPLAGVTQITVNAAGGNDTIDVGAFTNPMPGITIHGGTGDDTVNLNGDITFLAGASLDLDLQNDDAAPGTDRLSVAANANIVTSTTGAITAKVSRSIAFASGSGFETEDGALTLEANQQAASATGVFKGVEINGAIVRSTGAGVVTVKGKGGDSAAMREGVSILNGALLSGGTAGTTTVNGHGGSGPGGAHTGVFLAGPNSQITSIGSYVSVTGTGGGDTNQNENHGVVVRNNAQILAGGAGTVTVIGNGGNLAGTGSVNIGVFVFGTGSAITSGGGDISVTGTGGGAAGTQFNHGMQVSDSAAVTGTGTAKVTLIGTGGGSNGVNASHGFHMENVSAVTAVDGNISITGTVADGTTVSSGFRLSNAVAVGSKVQTTGTGTITVIADLIDISTSGVTIEAGANTVTLKPKTLGQLVDLGAADSASTLGLTDGELDVITAGTLQIGDAQSGPISISAVISPANYRTLALARDTTFSASGGFASDIGPTAADIEKITVTGTLTIDPAATLTTAAKGGFMPVTGQMFQIITNDDADAITGTFSGLPEGQTINPFLGVAINARITYLGDTGNDVVIITNTPPVANPVSVERYPTQSIKIPIATIMAQTSDPDPGDTVSFVSVGTPTAPAHGTVSVSGGFVFYKPTGLGTPGVDQNPELGFSYTVQDNHGSQTVGTVVIGIKVDNAPSQNITKLTMQPDGSVAIDFSGIPNRTYGLQFKVMLSDPSWTTIGPVTVDQYGAGHYVDGPPPHASASGFYRLVYPYVP